MPGIYTPEPAPPPASTARTAQSLAPESAVFALCVVGHKEPPLPTQPINAARTRNAICARFSLRLSGDINSIDPSFVTEIHPDRVELWFEPRRRVSQMAKLFYGRDRFAIHPPSRLYSRACLLFIKENVYNGDLAGRGRGHTNSHPLPRADFSIIFADRPYIGRKEARDSRRK